MNKVKRKLVGISIAVLAVLAVLAMTNAASAANPAANLEQCHNLDHGSIVNCSDPPGSDMFWGSGNAQATNAILHEGDSQNYRLILTAMPIGVTQTILIGQQFTKGGKMAYDFPTGPGNIFTATTPMGLPGIFPCDDGAGGLLVTPCDSPLKLPGDTAAGNKLSFPVIPSGVIPNATVNASTTAAQTTFYNTASTTSPQRSPNEMYIFGATPGSFIAYSFAGTAANVNTGDTDLNWNFTLTPTNSTVVIAWGAHISKTSDYASISKVTAVNISGSPYHTFLLATTFTGGKSSQDMQLASAAVVPSGTITIIKNTIPDSNQVFSYSSSLGSFSLKDNGTSPNSTSFTGLADGTYTVTEGAVAGFNLTNLTCDDSTGGTTTNLGTRTASIGLANGETVTCTFENTQNATLKIVKDARPDDAQDFNFTSPNASIGSFQLDDDADPNLPNSTTFSLNPGTYSVAETPVPQGWVLSPFPTTGCTNGNAVSSIVLNAGDSVTCTFVNTKNATLTIVKDAIPNDEQVFGFTGNGAIGNFNLKDNGTSVNSTTFDLQAGTYSVSEILPPGWNLTSATCSNGNATSSIKLSNGDTVTCTFTNGKLHLSFIKQGALNFSGNNTNYTINVTNDGFGNLTIVNMTDPNIAGALDCTPSLPNVLLKPGDTISCTVPKVGAYSVAIFDGVIEATTEIEIDIGQALHVFWRV